MKTGKIYGSLFKKYNDKLFDESVELFFKRHSMWKLPLVWFDGKKCLDAGCGGGRFMVALYRLGAKEVKGIDISKEAVEAANKRLLVRGYSSTAQVASILSIPFPNSYFDYVVSSGVIHHTPNPHKAFYELVRVLKPGGRLFLSVYGRGGIKWFLNDVFRNSFCKIVSFKTMEKIFTLMGIPPNKRYNILDNLYVEYVYRFTEQEIRKWLMEAGFVNIKRVKFERYDFEKPLSRFIHGEGWIQVYANKE